MVASVAPAADTSATFLSTAEVADRLRKNVQTIRIWLNSGILPGVKVGGSWLIAQVTLDSLIPQDAVARGQGRIAATAVDEAPDPNPSDADVDPL